MVELAVDGDVVVIITHEPHRIHRAIHIAVYPSRIHESDIDLGIRSQNPKRLFVARNHTEVESIGFNATIDIVTAVNPSASHITNDVAEPCAERPFQSAIVSIARRPSYKIHTAKLVQKFRQLDHRHRIMRRVDGRYVITIEPQTLDIDIKIQILDIRQTLDPRIHQKLRSLAQGKVQVVDFHIGDRAF